MGRGCLPCTLAQLGLSALPPPHPPLPCRLKASEAPELEEDEGFGDWAQKPELRQPLQGESPEGEQEARQVGVNAEREASGRLCQPPNTCLSNSPLLPFPASPPKRPHGWEGEWGKGRKRARRQGGGEGPRER